MKITVEPGIYLFKQEFWPLLGIEHNQWQRRKDDLLQWLNEFFEYELIEGKPLKIKIICSSGEYEPLPRKKYDMQKRVEERKQKYETYMYEVIRRLPQEFEPLSFTKMARDIIAEVTEEMYGHTNAEYVVRKFVKELMMKYGETNNKHVWVEPHTYILLDEELVTEWRNILEEEHISEQEAANAFYKQERGEDITKEKQAFAKARERFSAKHGYAPILVREWRAKRN